MKQEFKIGLKDGIPIAIGYFSVSFTFGIMAAQADISPVIATVISLTNMTSAGQFAGLGLITAAGSYIEMFLTQLVINLRYSLMSLSLSQKLSSDFTTPKRMGLAVAITDEIFALAASRPYRITPTYLAGLEILPIAGWVSGTFAGAVAGSILPGFVQSALGVALYAMFVAIVLPPARENMHIALVAVMALVISCLLYYLPLFSFISSGFSIIICTVAAAGIGALLFPIEDEEELR